MAISPDGPMRGRPQPQRAEVANHKRLRIVQNSLAETLLGRLRDRRTGFATFNSTSVELARIVLYEACRNMPLRDAPAEAFDGSPLTIPAPAESIAGVLILRAGLVFEPAIRQLLPDSPLYQLGLSRNEETLEPLIYTNNLPEEANWVDHILLVDPMLATGGSMTAALDVVRRHHAGRIDVLAVIAAPVGVKAILDHDPNVQITTLALDERLDARGYILPGLGDAGDRYFGTA